MTAGMFNYAGDSTFFRVASGIGEIWKLNNGLVEKASAITSPTISKKFGAKAVIGPDTFAVVDSGGQSMALISLSSGAVKEVPISSEVVAENRADLRCAACEVREGHIADGNAILYLGNWGRPSWFAHALVPAPKGPGISSVIKLETNGAAKTTGKYPVALEEWKAAGDGWKSGCCGVSSGCLWFQRRYCLVQTAIGLIAE